MKTTFSGSDFARPKPLFLICFAFMIFLLTGPAPVSAHDAADIITSFDGFDLTQEIDHEDADPWKGWLNLTVTNSGIQPWGDFHFEIYQVTDETVENVHFDVDSGAPWCSQTGFSWDVDNDVVGATLDFYFYSNPVEQGDTVSFSVYTDNTTDQVSFFGVSYYPTPVPIPSAVWLLGSGLIGLIGFRRKFKI